MSEISDILGVTIASPGYFELANEAARRFRKYSGLDALVITTDRNDSYDMKYILPLLGTRTLVFFDADLWFIRQVSFARFANLNGIAAVQDATRHSFHGTFCLQDALGLDMPPDRYINTGFMVINPRLPAVAEAFRLASALMAQRRAGEVKTLDVTEQSLLNAAFYRSGVDMHFLPDEWNFWPMAWKHKFYDRLPMEPYCIHAAGVPLDQKAEFLARHTAVFEA